jgi:hypothetical protein
MTVRVALFTPKCRCASKLGISQETHFRSWAPRCTCIPQKTDCCSHLGRWKLSQHATYCTP